MGRTDCSPRADGTIKRIERNSRMGGGGHRHTFLGVRSRFIAFLG